MCAPRLDSMTPSCCGRVMRSHRGLVLAALLMVVCTGSLVGQTQRPSIIPMAQGGGGSSAGASASGSISAAGGPVSGISDDPISPGEIIHVNVFNAPDFTLNTRVSESGEIAMPFLGAVHVAGLSSMEIGKLLATQLMSRDLLLDPEVTVTVEATATGVTVLGEVHSPGLFPLPGKHQLSDVLALAGGLTANTGRVIEISNNRSPEKREYIPWDPTMHNTDSYDHPVNPGDRVLVRACGIAYVGGNVGKPGAYSLCGSTKMTLSEVLSLAGGVVPLSSANHTVIVRPRPDGTRVTMEVDAHKVLIAKAPDMIVQEDDIIYVPPSGIKNAASRALTFAMTLAAPLLYIAYR